MKTLIITLSVLIVGTSAKAQLANTRWSGTMNVLTQQDVIFTFKSDTLSIQFPAIEAPAEVMSYKVKDGVIYLEENRR